MDFPKYPHLSTSQIDKCLNLVDSGRIISVSDPMSFNPIIIEENQLIRDYINYLSD